MDLAKDLLGLAEHVAHVPGLGTACSLAKGIINTVQISKNNTANLQHLAHLIAHHLITIADHMHGRWDDAPPNLSRCIDEYQAILEEVSKTVTKHSRTSRFSAFFDAGDREQIIKALERRLGDAQRSILLLLGMHTSIAVNQVHTALDAHRMETHAGMQRLEYAVQKLEIGSPSVNLDHEGFRGFTRQDIQLVRRICHFPPFPDSRTVVVTVHEAEICTDGRAVLVKTYRGPPGLTVESFMRDLTIQKRVWDPSFLQLLGACTSADSIPFQVYHAPRGSMESFDDWWQRTLKTNLVETVLGLYDMRTSIRALLEFHMDCSFPLHNSIVNVQPCGNGFKWTLIYAGVFLRKSGRMPEITIAHAYRIKRLTGSGHLVLSHDHSQDRSPVLPSFCGGGKVWAEDPCQFEDVINCDIGEVTLASISHALLQVGWLGACREYIAIPKRSIGLGDIGYMDHDGLFIFVTNLHTLLQPDGCVPIWTVKQWLEGWWQDSEDKVRGSLTYKRARVQLHRLVEQLEPPLTWGPLITLKYQDRLDQQALRVLQHHASEIVAANCLSIEPHELRFITAVSKFWSFELDWKPDPLFTDDSAASAVQQFLTPESRVQSSIPPTIYLFEQGDCAHIRESGIPEVTTRLGASFELEPAWLDDSEAWDGIQMNGIEWKDGFELSFGTSYSISYMQLPVGVATPYITESMDTPPVLQ